MFRARFVQQLLPQLPFLRSGPRPHNLACKSSILNYHLLGFVAAVAHDFVVIAASPGQLYNATIAQRM